jgi:hypothetical protein
MTAAKRPDPGARKGSTPAKASSRPDVRPAADAKPARVVPEKPPARGPLIAKLHKALRAQYKPVATNVTRPLLDQVLFACCLENAPAAVAEKAFAKLLEGFFDLNEIRVTTVAELAESLGDLPDPDRAALSLRRALQSVFESTYNFSLEQARKHSLAHGLKTLEHLHGISPFVVQHVASTALGGHFVPLDLGALTGLYLCGIITQAEYDAGRVPGLERTISKKAAAEFNSLLHQFGVECLENLHGTTVRKIVQAVNPAVKDRFPKRGDALPAPAPPPAATTKEQQKVAEAARQSAEAHRPAGPQAAARPAGKTPLPPPGAGPKRPDGKGATGKPGPKPFVVKPNMGKPAATTPPTPPVTAPPAVSKPVAKPAAKTTDRPVAKARDQAGDKAREKGRDKDKKGAMKPTARPAQPPAAKDRGPKRPASGGGGKSHARQLAKRKPR